MISVLIGFFVTSPVIAILSLLYIREYQHRQRTEKEKNQINEETQKKALELLSAVQTDETKILSGAQSSTKQIEAGFEAKLNEVLKSSILTAANAQKELTDFLGQLKNQAQASQMQSQKSVESRISELFDRLETRLSDFLMKTENTTTTSIELELRSARHMIDTYKTQQLALIDENIVAMLEQTLSIILAKKLSLKEQMDLIYEALEKAKVEKFLV